MARVMRPRRPQEKRNPKPTLKVSLVYFIRVLKTNSYDPKHTEATKPPTIIRVSFMNTSCYVSALLMVLSIPVPATLGSDSMMSDVTGLKRETRITEVTRQAIDRNFILLRLSLNMKYATIKTRTVFRAIIAPTMPPFMPALSAPLKEIVDAWAPTNSKVPPMKM